MDFKLNEYHRNVPDEELLKDVLRVASNLKKSSITQNDYKNNGGKYSASTIAKRFNGWLNALRLCGLTPTKRQVDTGSGTYTQSYITTQELIEDLKRVSALLDKTTFSSGDYNQNGRYSSATYFIRFKTWNNALESAGLVPFEVPSGKRVSNY